MREKNVAGINFRERKFFFSRQFVSRLIGTFNFREILTLRESFLLLFLPKRCKNDRFLHFPSFSTCQQFATLNLRDILIFKFLWHLIPATFCLKLAKTFSWLSRNFLPEGIHDVSRTFYVHSIYIQDPSGK